MYTPHSKGSDRKTWNCNIWGMFAVVRWRVGQRSRDVLAQAVNAARPHDELHQQCSCCSALYNSPCPPVNLSVDTVWSSRGPFVVLLMYDWPWSWVCSNIVSGFVRDGSACLVFSSGVSSRVPEIMAAGTHSPGGPNGIIRSQSFAGFSTLQERRSRWAEICTRRV